MKKGIILLLLLLFITTGIIVAAIVLIFGNKQVNYDELTQVRILKAGTMVPGGDEYTLTLKNGFWFASHNEIGGLESNIKETVVDDAFVNEIKNLLTENNAHNWDGFNKENKHVTDGERFTFYMCFSDGTEIEARGYMAYPKNFKPVFEEFEKHYEVLFKN